jgi:hypothetical protein
VDLLVGRKFLFVRQHRRIEGDRDFEAGSFGPTPRLPRGNGLFNCFFDDLWINNQLILKYFQRFLMFKCNSGAIDIGHGD